jgi:GNAT superfamily N-acetyltransferase
VDTTSILRLFDEERRIAADIDVTLLTGRYVVRAIGSENRWTGIVYSHFPDEEMEEVVDGEMEYFEKLDREFEWKVYSHDKPQGLLSELRRRGFRIGEEEALMIRDLREPKPSLTSPAPHGITVRSASDTQGVNDFVAVEAAIWPTSEKMSDQLLATLNDRVRRNLAFVAYESGLPIGCGRVTVPQGSLFAALWGGAVLPAFRGKGVYRALLAARIKHAQRFESVQFLRVDALPTSRPILEKYGFKQIASTWPAEWSPRR